MAGGLVNFVPLGYPKASVPHLFSNLKHLIPHFLTRTVKRNRQKQVLQFSGDESLWDQPMRASSSDLHTVKRPEGKRVGLAPQRRLEQREAFCAAGCLSRFLKV